MAFQVVPDTAHFAIMGVMNTGQDIINDVYVRNTVLGWNAVHLAATGTIIGDEWRDNMCPLLSSNYTFDKVRARDLGVEFGTTTDVEYNTAGTSAGIPLSPSVCCYVKFKGTGGAPPRRGGNFVSPFTEDDVAQDLWLAGLTGPVQIVYQDMTSAIQAQLNGDAMVIVSRYSKNANPVPPHLRDEGLTNTIAAFEAVERIAIQRDRRQGEGT